jgi:hypothetical protein
MKMVRHPLEAARGKLSDLLAKFLGEGQAKNFVGAVEDLVSGKIEQHLAMAPSKRFVGPVGDFFSRIFEQHLARTPPKNSRSFSFTLNVFVVLGEPKLFDVKDWIPIAGVSIDTFIVNAPQPGLVILDSASLDRVDFLYDERGEFRKRSDRGKPESYADAHTHCPFEGVAHSPTKFGPTPLRCERGARVRGRYTGVVPEGFKVGQQYLFCFSFIGWSRT